jgi:pimeloyl-ACP methyl ester carboxylesterase
MQFLFNFMVPLFNMASKTFLQAILNLASLFSGAYSISFPPPTGGYNTTITTAQLTDYSRLDPFSPIPHPRTLMVSVFAPVHPSQCSPSLIPYMDPITAAFEDNQLAEYGIVPGTLERFSMQVCKSSKSHSGETHSHHPTILFTPGFDVTRLFYSALAQQVSSYGYNVVTIDHPYDADIVVFPDNSTIIGISANITDEKQILQALNTRVSDISFVLDSLCSSNQTLTSSKNCHHVGIYGHSLGGAASASAIAADPRLLAGINMDGSFWGPIVQTGVSAPFLIFSHSNKTDTSWQDFWTNSTGWKKELVLNGSQHNTFSDLPPLASLLGVPTGSLADVLGTIDGARAFEVVGTYVVAFFDRFLKGKRGVLLNGPSVEFPEISFVTPFGDEHRDNKL